MADGLISLSVSRDYALVTARSDERARHLESRDRLLERIAQAGISIELLQFAAGRVRFACDAAKAQLALSVADASGYSATLVSPCAKLGIVGSHIPQTAGVISGIMRVLREAHVDLLHFADGGATLSVVVAQRQAEVAEETISTLLAPAGVERPEHSLSLDELRGLALVDGRAVRLGARQAQLLAYFIANRGVVVSAESIAAAVFNGSAKDVTGVRVHVHNLRKKIEHDPFVPRYLITVPNRGYSFVP